MSCNDQHLDCECSEVVFEDEHVILLRCGAVFHRILKKNIIQTKKQENEDVAVNMDVDNVKEKSVDGELI